MWKVEVVVDIGGAWCGNDLRFATKEEAETYARDLVSRWPAILDWRAVRGALSLCLMAGSASLMTRENSQHITLNDAVGRAQVEQWIIGLGTRAIAHAVISYARTYNIRPSSVQYSVRPLFPSETV